jgi:DNA-binding NarL/FixJ family response regulator
MQKALKIEPQTRAPKKVFIVEDHPVYREGLVQILRREKDLIVCGQAGDAEEALRDSLRLKPDLMLVDISLPGMSGLELIKELRALDREIKVLVVSMHDEALYADRVLRAGGDGYIMKQEDPEEIVHAIRDVLSGHIYVSEEVLARQSGTVRKRSSKAKGRPLDQLTDFELEVLELLGQGKTNEEIARKLQAPVAQVNADCATIQKKLKFETTNELIRYAVCWVETGQS